MFKYPISFLMSLLLVSCMGGAGKKEGKSVKAYLIDAPVHGVEYINPDGGRDITLIDGSFYCTIGSNVQFFVGGIKLGSVACSEGAKVYPMDLLPEAGVSREIFDTNSLSARVALLLLTISPYNNLWNRPETYTTSDRGPSSLVVSMVDRQLLNSYTEAVFDNDAAFVELINKYRCVQPYYVAGVTLEDVDLENNWSNGEISTANCSNTNLVDSFDPTVPNSIGKALAGAVLHMERAIYEHSGISANGYNP